jgi:hypothetical protein
MAVTGQLHIPSTLNMGKESMIPTEEEDEWAPVSLWTVWKRAELPAASISWNKCYWS